MIRIKGIEVERFKVLGKQAPKELFVEGHWDEKVFEGSVAIVGSRRMTDYGRRVLERMVPVQVGQGKTIISGFMYGVDMTAHGLTMASGGKTVAVLGWGLNERLVASDQRIADEIVKKGGMIISEWLDKQGALWTFPARNRIVAALCDEVIVIEAASKSGALITTDLAIKYGKPVWAVPGPVTSKVSEGTNKLISDGKAKIWLGVPSFAKASEGKSKILDLLDQGDLDASEIARRLGRPVEEVGAELTMLVLSGQVEEREGKYYGA